MGTNKALHSSPVLFGIAFLLVLTLELPNAMTATGEEVSRLIPLPQVEEPRGICAEHGRVYIVDDKDIAVYSFDDGRFLRKIGRVGQGPGEFKIGPGRLTVLEDRLAVRDMFQVIFFSVVGDYLGHVKEPAYMGFFPYLPVGENFVGFPNDRRADGSFAPATGCIFDGQGKLLKRFYEALPEGPPAPPPPGSGPPSEKRDAMMVREYVDYAVHDGKIFVADSRKGLSISVFDEGGNLLYDIRHDVDRVKVTRKFQASVLKEREKSKHRDYDNPVFPEFFPAFVGFKIDDDRIYIITPAQKDGLYEVIEMDLLGKFLERDFRFPVRPLFGVLEAFVLQYDIEGGKFLWVEYNEAKEIYELHVR
jgi:hypothetical protein